MSSTQPPARTSTRTTLLALGTLLLVGGFAAVVGLAVVGLAVVGFTRARILMGTGGDTRVTYEQDIAPPGGRYCSSCGRPMSPSARFCDSCGARLG